MPDVDPYTPHLTVKPSFVQLLVPSVVPTLLLAAYVGYNEFLKPANQPAAEPPLVVAAKAYVKTIPDAYDGAAQQVRNGVLVDKTSVVKALQGHARPLADALDAAFVPLVDDQGRILDPLAAAHVLSQVATALKKGM